MLPLEKTEPSQVSALEFRLIPVHFPDHRSFVILAITFFRFSVCFARKSHSSSPYLNVAVSFGVVLIDDFKL